MKDGTKLGFTDHNKEFDFLQVMCRPESGFIPDNNKVQGILSSDISGDDIRSGRLGEARLESYRVNWTEPTQFISIAIGYVGEIRQKGDEFELEWLDQASQLERSTGRVFSRLCDAEFGDVRCGLNAADFPEGTICPRTFTACQEQFSNQVNFRGFPYILGDDALLAAPLDGEIRDGSSRYQ